MEHRRQPAYEEQHQQALTDLFMRVRRNDEAAFTEFYERISRKLLAYCLAFTRNDEGARDLFQNVMIAAYENRHRFTGGNVLAWIFTIARNACRNWEATNKRYQPLDPAFDIPDETVAFLDDDETRIVHKAVLNLPHEFRSAVLLHYYGDMSVRDMAEHLGISMSLVKIRLFRARKRLTDALSASFESHV